MMERKPEVQTLPSMTTAKARAELMNDEYRLGWMEGKQGKMPNINCSKLYHQGWQSGRDVRRAELNITIHKEPLHKPRLWEDGEIEAELDRRRREGEAKHERWQASALRAEIVAACAS